MVKMEAEKISNFLRNPDYSNDNKLEDLTEVIQKYPYFQSARFLFLSELKNKESFKYNHEVKKTAAYTTDRSVLFELITKPFKLSPKNEEDILEEVIYEEQTKVKDKKLQLEKSLKIGEPLKFSTNDTHSFSEWLKLSSNQPIIRDEPKKEENTSSSSDKNLNQKFKLIDAFIKEQPKDKTIKRKNL